MRYRLDGSGLQWSSATAVITTGCAVGGCKGYELTRDLDFNDAASYQDVANMRQWTTDAGWQPIGTAEKPFTAIFKTNNSPTPNTIFNLTISRADENNVGLFSHIGSTAEISGIGLLDAKVEGNHQVGGLVGKNAGGQISNSYANGHVVGKGGEIGLLVGHSSGSITNSYANGEVSGEANGVGGLVGANHGEIANSYAMGSVVGSANNVGGLVGDNMQGTIKNCYTTGSVSGSEDIGGLVGLSNLGTLTSNYVSGKASGKRYIGGLVGSNIGGTITQSYWDKTASKLESDTGGVGLLASEMQSANAQDEDLKKPYYKWSTAHWDFGTAEQYPILKYATGSDLNNPVCGPEQTLPNCGALLLGQHASLKHILFLSDVNLIPNFKPTELNYQLGITTGTKTLQLIPIASNPDSSINISRNGTVIDSDLASRTTSSVITLSENTEIVIEVSATNQRPAQYNLTTNYLQEITILGIPDKAIDEGESIILDASQNLATADTLLSYRWTQSGGKTLFPPPDSEGAILWLHIPEDYVPATAEHVNLGLTLEINDGKATLTKNITLTIAKVDNGNIPIEAPRLDFPKWTAAEIDLDKDPDGNGKDFSYQWQSRAPGQDAKWIDINEATKKTHIMSFLTESYTEYRVLISYTDGQGYKSIAASRTALYVPKITILDFIKDIVPGTIPEDAKPQRTSHSTTATTSKCSTTDIDKDNDGLIDICDLEGLNAMRYVMDGSGYKQDMRATTSTLGCSEGGTGRCKGYELMKDLDFNDDASYSNATDHKSQWTTGEGWEPIGSSSNPFKAIFEGNGHTISNLMIDRFHTKDIGLFGYIGKLPGDMGGDTEIIDVGLLNVEIKGRQFVGGLVGLNSRGKITKSYATGVVLGVWNRVGVLVGKNNSIVTKSHAMGMVGAGSIVGGLIGDNHHGSITNSYAASVVNSTRHWLGGLVGYNGSNITNSYATGGVTGPNNAGGLIGYNDGKITNSYATGAVVVKANNAGGLVGYSDGSITNSYATGGVTGASNAGGLVGYSNGGDITNSYAIGSVVGTSVAGGLVGRKSYSSNITNSYWDRQTSQQMRSAGGIGKTTTELQLPTTATGIYISWKSKNWDFGTSEQYPILNYAKGFDRTNPACREAEDPPDDLLPECGSVLSPLVRYGLRELRLVKGDLSPQFLVLRQNYTGTVVNTPDTIQFKPTAIDPNAKIFISADGRVVNEELSSGTTSNEIMLKPSSTTKIIMKIKKGGIVQAEYTLNLNHYNLQRDIDEDGDGLIDIHTLEELNAMRYQLDGTGYRSSEGAPKITIGCPENKCKGYELMEDLDFSDKSEWTTGAGWQPIGGEIYRFSSIFEGNNKTISNLRVNRPQSNNLGLFGVAGVDAEISNIGVLNVNIRGDNSIGGLAGVNLGIITNSYTTGEVAFGRQRRRFGEGEGGLVGYNKGVVANSYSLIKMSGRKHVGGLVGRNDGKITNSYAEGTVFGRFQVGGLVGLNENGAQIANSYAIGKVGGRINIGGLVGLNANRSHIANSYANTRLVLARDHYAGGLVGQNQLSTISNSYAVSIRIGAHNPERAKGLVGLNNNGTTIASYWDTETSGKTDSAGGIGKTTTDLQGPTDASDIYASWDTTDWDFGTSNQYPILKYAKGDGNNPACSDQAGTDLPVCGSLLPSVLRGLSELRLVKGNLSPSFIVTRQNYVGTVVNSTSTIQFKPIVLNPTATISISVDGRAGSEEIDSGATSDEIVLKQNGRTKIIISVKYEGTVKAEYTLHLNYHNFKGDIDIDDNGLIEINSLEDLNAMRYQLDGTGYRDSEDAPKIAIGCPGNKCKGYELKENLDFNDAASYRDGNVNEDWTMSNRGGWEPIGSFIKPFKAIFEGNGYTISNLMINRSNTDRAGLFAHIRRGTIMNIGLLNINIKGRVYVGGIVGSSRDSDITNSYVSGSVEGEREVGSLAGTITNGTITNSYATSAVEGISQVGGLIGSNYGDITNSYATGVVTGIGSNVGGLVGQNADESQITNSYATGVVTGTGSNVGGLVGLNNSSNITYSYWDKTTSGKMNSDGGIGKTTTELQSPTTSGSTSTEIYYGWSAADWHFGTSNQYPALKYAKGPDTDNPVCGSGQQPACDTLLRGQQPDILEQLTVSPGTLSHLFNPQRLDYDVRVKHTIDDITLNTTATGAEISIASNTAGTEVSTMDHSSVTIPLTITGDTIITITVSKDGVEQIYTVKVRHNLYDPNNYDPDKLPDVVLSISRNIPEGYELRPEEILDNSNYEWQLISSVSTIFAKGPEYTIPDDFVEVGQAQRELKLTLTGRNEHGISQSEKITLTVFKDNNGAAVIVAKLEGSQLSATITTNDPDHGQSNVSYQWQQQINDEWHSIARANAESYTIPTGTTDTTRYRVKVSYTDGQGYSEIASSSEVTYRDIDQDDDGLIEISTLEELDAIRNNLAGTSYKTDEEEITAGCPEDGCKGYELEKDLDFQDAASYRDGNVNEEWTMPGREGWQPIGDDSNSFSSTFKGNGYPISNLSINREEGDYIGLFAMINNSALIDGIDLYKVNIKGNDHVGALVGKNAGGTIKNSSVSGDNNTTSTVVGTGQKVGGLVGINDNRTELNPITVTVGKVINSFADVHVIGVIPDSGDDGSSVGGLIGINKGIISNSYAAGNVSANKNVGGLVGRHEGGEITNSYATGTTTGTSYVGGLAGLNSSGNIMYSYWDTQTSKIKASVGGGGEGKITTDLQSPTTATGIYSSWSEEIWDFGTREQYPALKGDDGTLLAGQRLGLQSLELSDKAILNEVFGNTTYSYIMFVAHGAETIQTTPTAADPDAEITLSTSDDSNETTQESGHHQINLAEDTSTVTIVVKANNREVTYTFAVKRVEIQGGNNIMRNEGDSKVSLYARVMNNVINLDQGNVPFRVKWEWMQIEGKPLLATTTIRNIEFSIPVAYVDSDASSATVTLKVTGIFTRGDEELRSSTEVELTINNVDNGHITGLLKAPRLEEATERTDLHLVAPGPLDYVSPTTKTDPDNGINADKITYQWQSLPPGSNSWSNIDGNKKTYEIPHTSPFNTQYRVKLGYTDGQGHPRGIEDGEDRLVSEAITVRYFDRDNNGLIDILSAEALAAIRDQQDMAATTSTVGCPEVGCEGYELKAHIDLKPTTDTRSHINLQPIGNANNPFNAIFEGNHYTISNLTISSPDSDNVGLFGTTTRTAEIRNVGLLNVNIAGMNKVGGLIGHNEGKVIESYVIAAKGDVMEIAGTDNVGGLIGHNEGEVIGSYIIAIEAKPSFPNISGSGNVGGLIGQNKGEVIKSHVIAKLIVGGSMVGGLVGLNSNTTITESYAIVKNIISDTDSTGGLVGKTSGGVISNSYAKVDNMTVNKADVCPDGSLMLVGIDDDATNRNAIIESKIVGGCGRLPLFDQ